MEWLKAAEGIFEGLDRKAKLVVSELSDEQSDVQLPASNREGSQVKGTKLKKAQKRVPTNGPLKTTDTAGNETSLQTLEVDSVLDKDKSVPPLDNGLTISSNSAAEANNDQQHSVGESSSTSNVSLPEMSPNNVVEHGSNHMEVPVSVADTVVPLSAELVNDSTPDIREGTTEGNPSSPSVAKEIEVISNHRSADSGQSISSEDVDVPSKIDQEILQSLVANEPINNGTQLKDVDLKSEPYFDQKRHQELKIDPSLSTKIQDQLDEAQGLLKSAVSTGQSKEARLARVCAGLSSRLQEYKSENAQLEELLFAERELSKSYEGRMEQLKLELSGSKTEVTRVESLMADALAAKNSEIESLVSSIESVRRQAALSEGNLASLQASMESIMRNRELSETRMMQALREEASSAERRAEDEHAAHNATKKAAMEREVEFERRAIEGATALARTQRAADERAAKAQELEQKVAMLEVECGSLSQELQDMEARMRRGQMKSAEDANQALQMQALQEEVERARQGQRDAESKQSSLEVELQKMRVEMAAMKRDAEHYSRQEHMELEKRYRDLTDLLCSKQTQLETMATEKSAAEFQLEKQLNRIKEMQVESEKVRSVRRVPSYWDEDTDIKSLEALPLHHRHMEGTRIQLRKAAKFIDSGAVRATGYLRRYPTARITLLCYLVCVHLFLMYLLHRLQERADSYEGSMGISASTLPRRKL